MMTNDSDRIPSDSELPEQRSKRRETWLHIITAMEIVSKDLEIYIRGSGEFGANDLINLE